MIVVHVNSKNFAESGIYRLKTSAARQKYAEVEIVIFAHKNRCTLLETFYSYLSHRQL